MARVSKGSYTFIHKWIEPNLHLLQAAEHHSTLAGTYLTSR